jgi:type IV secretory pathway VirB6-like protein
VIKNFARYISKIILVVIFTILSFSQKELYGARDNGAERVRQCDPKTGQVSPFEAATTGKEENTKVGSEFDYDLSNQFCVAHFAASYAAWKVAVNSLRPACNQRTATVFSPSPVLDFLIIRGAFKDINKTKTCKPAFIASMATISGIFLHTAFTHASARQQYYKVRVCGSDWKGPDKEKYVMASGMEGSYSKEVFDARGGYKGSIGQANLADDDDENAKKYREWFYGGKEFRDRPAEGEECKDPSRGDKSQRYYFRGLSSNFMCEKYNPHYFGTDPNKKYKKAYECCLERSQNYICLDKKEEIKNGIGVLDDDHIFCRANSKCTFKKDTTVKYETYTRDSGRLICAKSYSLCPFNFAVGGGSPYPDYFADVDKDKKPITVETIEKSKTSKISTKEEIDAAANACQGAESRDSACNLYNEKLGKLKNYCQYYRHCTVISGRPYVADLEILNPYYSKACIDFIGDSQNGVQKTLDPKTGVSYNGGLLFGQQTNFSAPIVQCFKETMKNIFTNTAGHSRCLNGGFGNSANECLDASEQESYLQSGDFVYKKGNKVKPNSLFEFLQKRLKMIITTVLVISMTFLGFKILVGKLDLSNKKEILVYIVKIAFVVYFVNGTAWKDVFFDGIYNGSNEISRIFFKIKFSSDDPNGCNFGSQYTKDGIKKTSSVNYPKGSDYLMVWDTLDCKIMQYLNYGPGFSTSPILVLIIAAFFTGGIGLIIALSVFIMAVCLIVAVIRAMHIFISSAIAIIIYIFVSPIIIPLVLFERTKGIFDAWLSHLMSFTLSPIVLFAYLAIFINLSEDIMFGGANGFKDGKVDCSQYCINASGVKHTEKDCNKEKVEKGLSELINPLDYSVACLLNFNNFEKNPGFALFGIALPSLGKLLEPGKVETRVLLILKSALFLFILAQFMDEIPSIISKLTGEVIDVKSSGYIEVMKKFTSTMRGIQKRGARLVKGGAQSGIKKIKNENTNNKKGGKGESTDIVSGE